MDGWESPGDGGCGGGVWPAYSVYIGGEYDPPEGVPDLWEAPDSELDRPVRGGLLYGDVVCSCCGLFEGPGSVVSKATIGVDGGGGVSE